MTTNPYTIDRTFNKDGVKEIQLGNNKGIKIEKVEAGK